MNSEDTLMTMSQGPMKTFNRHIVMDPVHGAIGILNHERKVIDHPLFQRLRHVMQNDVLHMSFVGATHTRFAHSIGALHVASRIYNQIIRSRMADMETDGVHSLKISKAQELAIAYLGQCLRLAILLHDSGHAAFSHQMENASCIQEMLNDPELPKALWRGVDTSNFYSKLPSSLHHEHYSIRSAHKILTECRISDCGFNVEDILSIMETTDDNPSDDFIKQAELAWPIFTCRSKSNGLTAEQKALHILQLLQKIVSGEFDADKGDYLLRDSYFTGVSYGKYDIDTLINNIGVAWMPECSWFGLVVNEKGVGALEDMIYSRFKMYSHVYNHKTTNGMEQLLHLAMEEVLEEASVKEDIHDFFFDIDEFTYLTDDYLWEKFRSKARKDKNSYSYKLINREKLKLIAKEENLPEFRINLLVKKYADELGVPVSRIVTSTKKLKFSKINNQYTDIKVVSRSPFNNERDIFSITEKSNFFEKFSDITSTTFHLKD